MIPRVSLILLVCCSFTTATGCQVLGIPSHRMNSAHHNPPAAPITASHEFDSVASGIGYSTQGDCSSDAGMQNAGMQKVGISANASCDGYRTGILPPIPVPNWFAKWHKDEEPPEAPGYPRFQPLPTRPMFSQPPRGEMLIPTDLPNSMKGNLLPPPRYGDLSQSTP